LPEDALAARLHYSIGLVV